MTPINFSTQVQYRTIPSCHILTRLLTILTYPAFCFLCILQVRDPLPLTIHHMPIAVTFAYFGEGNIVVCTNNSED